MRSKQPLTTVRLSVAVLTITLALAGTGSAGTYKVLHAFNGTDGTEPEWGVIPDSAGNLYGTTAAGGLYNKGTVYELSPTDGGGWTQAVIYAFTGAADGYQPEAPLIMDANGNLFGTTLYGGANSGGVLFELSPVSGGGWAESVLYNFHGSFDFHSPRLTFDSVGDLYGAATAAGLYSFGEVFELTPVNGMWIYSALYSFGGTPNDGQYPEGTVTFDSAGNLFGTTVEGGTTGLGTLFELTPGIDGTWNYSLLHSFVGSDGTLPGTGVSFNSAGKLFGTTGSSYICGADESTIFEGRFVRGVWTNTVLHTFTGGQDGCRPLSTLAFDSLGNFYGTTNLGGRGTGVVFKATSKPGGGWTGRVLYEFKLHMDGGYPTGKLFLDSKGNIYGVAGGGGPGGYGVVYEISP
jgi:uncharacterized repeat protein (TIGR03803 family)